LDCYENADLFMEGQLSESLSLKLLCLIDLLKRSAIGDH